MESQIFESNEFPTNPPSEKFDLHPIVGVESNQTNFESICIEFFEYFLPFGSNRLANFRIESNEFQINSNLTSSLT